MDPIIKEYLSEVEVGELQTFQNMSCVPLFPATNGGPDYILLKEALAERRITITEVHQSGSVPELKAVNTSPRPILLLDGEELTGAKQNRVLNTSILLKAKSETVIPVSCTEQGRWRYSSPTFADSDVIMSQRGRASKADAVTASLQADRGYASDQRRVWAHVQMDHLDAGTSSPTGAMKDVYTARSRDLDAYVKAFECLPQQRGSLVLINGEPAGLDVVSREGAYATLHRKLIRSYALDALLQRRDGSDEASVDGARAFLGEALDCRESRFESTGLGYDYRFDGSRIVGSALVFEQTVIHAAFFRLERGARDDPMSGYRQRRDYRRIRR